MAGLLLAVAVAASCLLAAWTFRVATRVGPDDRRMLVLLGMAAPVLILGVLLGGSLTMMIAGCPLFTPADYIVSATVAGSFLALLAIACTRQLAAARKARADLEAIAEPVSEGPLYDDLVRLAADLGVRTPQLRIAGTPEVLACSAGIRRPMIVLSTGLLDRLDDQERAAVVAHELAHLKQRDHLLAFLIGWLRDGLSYVPTGRTGWEHYRHDREIACDAMSATATGHPGALASALFKIGTDAGRLSHLLGDFPPARASRAFLGYGILVAGVMGTIVVLSPVWYMPVCMNVFCRLGG